MSLSKLMTEIEMVAEALRLKRIDQGKESVET